MNRRAFLVALLAPFLNRFVPKQPWWWRPSPRLVFLKSRQLGYTTNSAICIQQYISQAPRFQFGFTGFRDAQRNIDVSGKFLIGSNLMVSSPHYRSRVRGL